MPKKQHLLIATEVYACTMMSRDCAEIIGQYATMAPEEVFLRMLAEDGDFEVNDWASHTFDNTINTIRARVIVELPEWLHGDIWDTSSIATRMEALRETSSLRIRYGANSWLIADMDANELWSIIHDRQISFLLRARGIRLVESFEDRVMRAVANY